METITFCIHWRHMQESFLLMNTRKSLKRFSRQTKHIHIIICTQYTNTHTHTHTHTHAHTHTPVHTPSRQRLAKLPKLKGVTILHSQILKEISYLFSL